MSLSSYNPSMASIMFATIFCRFLRVQCSNRLVLFFGILLVRTSAARDFHNRSKGCDAKNSATNKESKAQLLFLLLGKLFSFAKRVVVSFFFFFGGGAGGVSSSRLRFAPETPSSFQVVVPVRISFTTSKVARCDNLSAFCKVRKITAIHWSNCTYSQFSFTQSCTLALC